MIHTQKTILHGAFIVNLVGTRVNIIEVRQSDRLAYDQGHLCKKIFIRLSIVFGGGI